VRASPPTTRVADLLWLGFMTPVVAVHDLLTEDGVLAVLIDAHNLPQLGVLLNDRFGSHRRPATPCSIRSPDAARSGTPRPCPVAGSCSSSIPVWST